MTTPVRVLGKILPLLDRLAEVRVVANGRRITLELSGVLVVPLGAAGKEHDVEKAVLRVELLGHDHAVLQEVRVVPRSALKRAGYAMAGGDRTAAAALVNEARKAGIVADVKWAAGQTGALPARITFTG